MGANQSGGSKSRFAPGEFATLHGANRHNKNSFGKQQLNRLFRKSLPIQSRQVKCNGVESTSGSKGNKSIYGPESIRGGSDRNRPGVVLDNNEMGKYFVTGRARERFVGSNSERDESQDENNAHNYRARAMATTAAESRDSQRKSSSSPSAARRQTQQAGFRPLEPAAHQLVRSHQQRQLTATEHHNKSMTTANSSQQHAAGRRQPFNSSNSHQPYQLQGLGEVAIGQQQQQSNGSLGLIRPNKVNNKPAPKQHQQLKSSCSPSSASAASSPSASSSSAGFSSSESLKLQQQRQQMNALNSAAGQRAAPNSSRPSLPSSTLATRVNEQFWPATTSNDQHEWQHQRQLVAMQQSRHRRAHSSGQPLSWSKQQVPMDLVANGSKRQQQQQGYLLANQIEQTSRGQLDAGCELHQMLSPDLYHQLQRQQQQQQQSHSMNNFKPMEQPDRFYTENLHLVTGDHSPEACTNQTQINQQFYSNVTPSSMSAPLQRRSKWSSQPPQHYQLIDSNGGCYQTQDLHPNQQQHQFHQGDATQIQQQQLSETIYDEQLGCYVPLNQSHVSPFGYELAGTLQPFSAHLLTNHENGHNTIESRGKTFSSSGPFTSATKTSRSRSRNPLTNIFATSTLGSTPDKRPFGANTIHHFKSHQHLPTTSSISRSASHSNNAGGGHSLKRIKSSPLTTAQQSSYEAMRTIDMYLIRQIARSCMDFEMEQKIDLEIRLRELAAQSLLEATTEIEVLEVEKSLLTSDQRMNCYAVQLEQKRKRLSNPSLSTADSGRGSKASRWDSSRRTFNTSSGQDMKQARSDVIGAKNNSPNEFDSPSGSSLSKGFSQMSPVSNESASSPSKQSPPPASSANTASSTSPENYLEDKATQQHSWSSLSRSNHHVIRRPTSTSNTLNRRRKSQRQQHRERLAQLIARQYNIDYTLSPDTKATLTLSELRVPLMWRDVDHFKGRGEYRRYAVFCLAKIGSQIYDTQLISDVDRQLTDLTFEDLILFNNVELDFELELEVYSCVYLEQFSLSSTPRKLMEKLSNSVGRAMGRRLATQTASVNYIKELEAYDKSYRFTMIASSKLTLVDSSDSIKTYDLHLMSPEAHGRHSMGLRVNHQAVNGVAHQSAGGIAQAQNGAHALNRYHQSANNHSGIVTASNQRDLHKNMLPLFGHFCCRLHVRPDVLDDKHATSGYL